MKCRRPSFMMSITSRALFSLWILFLTASMVVGEQTVINDEYNHEDLLDLIVIGSGWAGMAAADYVLRAASTPVSLLVLESSNRTGGRSLSYTIGDSDGVGTFVVELGSMWIMGSDETQDTPKTSVDTIVELARRIDLNTTIIPQLQWIHEISKVYNSKGEDADPKGMIRKKLDVAEVCIWNAMKDGTLNTSHSIWEVYSSCGWIPKTEEEVAVDVASRECLGNATDVETIVFIAADENSAGAVDHFHFVTDQNSRGYSSILDFMVDDTIPVGDSRLIFNAHVSHIAYNENGVTLSTRDGRKFRAREVINTMSLGVLQHTHSSLFDPPLPAERVSLLQMKNVFGMKNVTKLVLQFPTVWWDNEHEYWASGVKEPFKAWRNLNHEDFLPGSNLLMSIFGDPWSSMYESMEDDQVQQEVMRSLRSQFRDVNIPDPLHFVMSRHGADETKYGAFSYIGTGWKEEYSDILWAPLRDSAGKARVWFAGEACCLAQHGYTHGALQSGKEVAARFLYENGWGQNPADQADLNACRQFEWSSSEATNKTCFGYGTGSGKDVENIIDHACTDPGS